MLPQPQEVAVTDICPEPVCHECFSDYGSFVFATGVFTCTHLLMLGCSYDLMFVSVCKSGKKKSWWNIVNQWLCLTFYTLCIWEGNKKHFVNSLAPRTQTSFSLALLGSWRRIEERHHKKSVCLYSSVSQPAGNSTPTHTLLLFNGCERNLLCLCESWESLPRAAGIPSSWRTHWGISPAESNTVLSPYQTASFPPDENSKAERDVRNKQLSTQSSTIQKEHLEDEWCFVQNTCGQNTTLKWSKITTCVDIQTKCNLCLLYSSKTLKGFINWSLWQKMMS